MHRFTCHYVISGLGPLDPGGPWHLSSLVQYNGCYATALARADVNAPKFSHTTPILKSLHWLKINECIEYKLLSLTYKVLLLLNLYLRNLISFQSPCRTRSSSVVTISAHWFSFSFFHNPFNFGMCSRLTDFLPVFDRMSNICTLINLIDFNHIVDTHLLTNVTNDLQLLHNAGNWLEWRLQR